jgi:hypothetical protein
MGLAFIGTVGGNINSLVLVTRNDAGATETEVDVATDCGGDGG